MGLVRESIPDGYTGILSQFLRVGMREAAIFNTIVQATKHPRRIFHRLFVPDVRTAGTDIGHMRSLFESCYFETTASARRIFLKDERKLLAFQTLHLSPGVLCCL